MFEYRATPLRVIDGDTVEFSVDLGLNVHRVEVLRLANIDTPEINSSDPAERADANRAKAHVHAALFSVPGRTVIVRTEKPYPTDKYGRWLGTIVLVDSGKQTVLNEELVRLGLAKLYGGGAR